MMRRPSTILRALRAMTAVIAVWCLGCSGFEPLLDAALGSGSSVMTCGSGRGAMSASMLATTDGSTGRPTISAASDAHQGFDCGCGSCHSASPSEWTLPPVSHVAPIMAIARIGELVSVVRTPLLPPPQHTA